MKARQRKKNNRSAVDYQQNIAATKKAGIKRPRLYLRVTNGLLPEIKIESSNISYGMSVMEAGRLVAKAFVRLGQAYRFNNGGDDE